MKELECLARVLNRPSRRTVALRWGGGEIKSCRHPRRCHGLSALEPQIEMQDRQEEGGGRLKQWEILGRDGKGFAKQCCT